MTYAFDRLVKDEAQDVDKVVWVLILQLLQTFLGLAAVDDPLLDLLLDCGFFLA